MVHIYSLCLWSLQLIFTAAIFLLLSFFLMYYCFGLTKPGVFHLNLHNFFDFLFAALDSTGAACSTGLCTHLFCDPNSQSHEKKKPHRTERASFWNGQRIESCLTTGDGHICFIYVYRSGLFAPVQTPHPDRLAFNIFLKDTKLIEQIHGLALQVLITKKNTSSEWKPQTR